ncbi:MAG: peptidoglycan-binding protein [Archangium sp.]|nr:peptidoglycan-binding protein [Archangium sp.]
MTTTLRPGMTSASVRVLQQRLKAVGTFDYPKATGFYGGYTREAVSQFERRNHLKVDGIADPAMQALLAKKAAGTKAPAKPATWQTAAEPAHDYRRVNFRGVTVNVRTQQMLLRAEKYAKAMGVKVPFGLAQGSYNPGGVTQSGGTHDRGGALDIRTRDHSPGGVVLMVKALRQAGFAAWSRDSRDGFSPHIHAVAIGDRQLSAAAANQVQSYFAGRNGLRNNAPDRDRATAGRPIPNWARRYD